LCAAAWGALCAAHIAGRVITVTKKLLEHPKVKNIDLSDELLDTPVKAKT